MVGAIIRNEKGEVMAVMSAKGPPIGDSKKAKILACRRAMEFAIDVGFTNLVINGDNAAVMSSISSLGVDQSRLGHIIKTSNGLLKDLDGYVLAMLIEVLTLWHIH